MSEEEFEAKFGRPPIDDELERINCDKVGTIGHQLCGWCDEHNTPRYECSCWVINLEGEG